MILEQLRPAEGMNQPENEVYYRAAAPSSAYYSRGQWPLKRTNRPQ